jgi:DnaK suppressor protein
MRTEAHHRETRPARENKRCPRVTDSQWSRAQRLLLARRALLQKRLWDEEQEWASASSVEPGDTGDDASYNSWSAVSSEITEREVNELRQIEAALQRIRRGVYHLCASCGQRIPRERRTWLPHTTLCVDCQREEEVSGSARQDDRGTPAGWEHVHAQETGEIMNRQFDRPEATLRRPPR